MHAKSGMSAVFFCLQDYRQVSVIAAAITLRQKGRSMLKDQLPRWDSIFGPLICGVAWGFFAGLVVWTVLKPEHHSAISNQVSMECFCVCIAIMGGVGLAAGAFADAKYRQDPNRIEMLAKCWKAWAISIFIFAVLNEFWLPDVQ